MIEGTHRYPRTDAVIYGRPAAEAVAELAKGYGARRLLIVTTRSLDTPNGVVAGLRTALGGACVGVFSAIRAHSPREDVVACAEFARATDADLLVALGGGSVIDAVKVVQLCLWGDLRDPAALDALRGAGGRDLQAGVRAIALPTTLSAAEFTGFAGVTDTTRRTKEGYAHPLAAPRAVVLDPRLTLETPDALWFSTGIKAVDHAVEQLCSPTRAPFADALAEDGLKRLAAGLPATKADPRGLDARLECQFGMWLAISGASAGSGLGASHAIGHILGGAFGVPHGLTSCVALPAVLAWNAGVNPERQALVAQLMGRPGEPAAAVVKAFVAGLGLPTRLADVGISSDQFQAIGEATMHDRGVRSNPRPIAGPADVVEILRLAV
jgi:maleylacetate reductase